MQTNPAITRELYPSIRETCKAPTHVGMWRKLVFCFLVQRFCCSRLLLVLPGGMGLAGQMMDPNSES